MYTYPAITAITAVIAFYIYSAGFRDNSAETLTPVTPIIAAMIIYWQYRETFIHNIIIMLQVHYKLYILICSIGIIMYFVLFYNLLSSCEI